MGADKGVTILSCLVSLGVLAAIITVSTIAKPVDWPVCEDSLSVIEVNLENLVDLACPVQTDSHGKVSFVRSDSMMTWEQGKRFCESKGLKMARVYNSQENEAIFAMKMRLKSQVGDEWRKSAIYLGGSVPEGLSHSISKDEFRGMFTWWNGDKVEDIGWHSGEPNFPGRERFIAVYFHGEASESWADYGWHSGYTTGYAACEYRIGYEG